MGYIYIFILLAYFIKVLKGDLSLQIYKHVNGSEVPVYDTLQELAGTNLTLICKIVTTSNDTTNYFDYELSWGRNRKNVQFNNIMDLKKLATDSLKPLLQFINKEQRNEAAMPFHPLFLLDSGKYFCMSLKYKLFSIVQISVNVGLEPTELATYFQALDNSHLDFNFVNLNKPLGFPKYMCTDDMFICNSGSHCFNDEYVCDGVRDCNDGSDENFYLCGFDRCAGKKRCSNGRCISNSLCCDKFRDPYCTVNINPACCLEKEEKYHGNSNEGHPVVPIENDDFDISNELSKHETGVQTIWKNHEEIPRIESLWIVVPCFIILILVIVCIMVRQTCMKPANRTRSIRSPHCTLGIPASNSREISLVSGRTSPASGRMSSVGSRISSIPGSLHQDSTNNTRNINGSLSRSVSPNMNPNFDLPPSYDEAMANSHTALP